MWVFLTVWQKIYSSFYKNGMFFSTFLMFYEAISDQLIKKQNNVKGYFQLRRLKTSTKSVISLSQWGAKCEFISQACADVQ